MGPMSAGLRLRGKFLRGMDHAGRSVLALLLWRSSRSRAAGNLQVDIQLTGPVRSQPPCRS